MRVLLITVDHHHSTTGSGGVARMIAGMSNVEFCIDVVSEDTGEAKRNGVDFIGLKKVPYLYYNVVSRRYWSVIRRKLDERDYDIIVFNDIWLAYRATHFLNNRNRKEAIAAFMHDDNTLDTSDLKIFSGRWISFRSREYIESKIIPHLDAVLTNSDYMTMLLKRRYPDVKTYRFYYAAMNYREVAFHPRQINANQPLKILFIKNDFERGGLKELIGALKSLLQFHFHLTIVGPALRTLRRKLGNLVVNNSNLTIDMLGPVTDQARIKVLYQNHDIVCVPSRREALGLVNAEALASGVPVVSTGVGGIPEVLDDGRGGIITKGLGPNDIASGILECLTNVHRTTERVIHGRKFVIERFDKAKMASELMTIFRDVLNKRRRN